MKALIVWRNISYVFPYLACVSLAGCATTPACPPLPQMDVGQSLQEYTIEVVRLYNECREAR